MQEKKLRDALNWLVHLHHGVSKGGDVIDEETGERIPIPVTDSEWRAALQAAEQALASTTEETEMEKLGLMVKALEGTERGFSQHYMEKGDIEGSRDCTMKANGMGKILDVIATQFGEEEGDADREGD